MQLAKRVESLPPYLFAEISKKIAAKRAEGHDVVTFAIGDPDLPTPRSAALERLVRDAEAWLRGRDVAKAMLMVRPENTAVQGFYESMGYCVQPRTVLNKWLDGFDGKLTSSKWAAIGKCSQDTALRDITELVERGVLKKSAASGRSTRYELAPVGNQV